MGLPATHRGDLTLESDSRAETVSPCQGPPLKWGEIVSRDSSRDDVTNHTASELQNENGWEESLPPCCVAAKAKGEKVFRKHERHSHAEMFHKDNKPARRVKARWEEQDTFLMATIERRVTVSKPKAQVKDIVEQVFVDFGGTRTREAIKCHRKQAEYRRNCSLLFPSPGARPSPPAGGVRLASAAEGVFAASAAPAAIRTVEPDVLHEQSRNKGQWYPLLNELRPDLRFQVRIRVRGGYPALHPLRCSKITTADPAHSPCRPWTGSTRHSHVNTTPAQHNRAGPRAPQSHPLHLDARRQSLRKAQRRMHSPDSATPVRQGTGKPAPIRCFPGTGRSPRSRLRCLHWRSTGGPSLRRRRCWMKELRNSRRGCRYSSCWRS